MEKGRRGLPLSRNEKLVDNYFMDDFKIPKSEAKTPVGRDIEYSISGERGGVNEQVAAQCSC